MQREHHEMLPSIALQYDLTVVSADNDFRRIKEARYFPLETWYGPSS